MITSLTIQELKDYTSRQLNYFFPDNNIADLNQYHQAVVMALEKMEHCYKRVTLKHYYNGEHAIFNHLHSDHYVMYLWYLSNAIWKETQDSQLCNKIYYLNKSLHAFDCMYNTNLPDIFLVFHGAGTMLGKAFYDDYFVVLHGCTIGSHNGQYPVMGKGVSLTANSSVIGNCVIGNRVSLGVRSCIFNRNIDNDNTIFLDKYTGALNVKGSPSNYAQQFFNVNLSGL